MMLSRDQAVQASTLPFTPEEEASHGDLQGSSILVRPSNWSKLPVFQSELWSSKPMIMSDRSGPCPSPSSLSDELQASPTFTPEHIYLEPDPDLTYDSTNFPCINEALSTTDTSFYSPDPSKSYSRSSVSSAWNTPFAFSKRSPGASSSCTSSSNDIVADRSTNVACEDDCIGIDEDLRFALELSLADMTDGKD